MSGVIADSDYEEMERQRRLRNGEVVEYVLSQEEVRQAEARAVILAREMAEYAKTHKPVAGAVSVKELAKHLGVSVKEVDGITPEERLQAANAITHSRRF